MYRGPQSDEQARKRREHAPTLWAACDERTPPMIPWALEVNRVLRSSWLRPVPVWQAHVLEGDWSIEEARSPPSGLSTSDGQAGLVLLQPEGPDLWRTAFKLPNEIGRFLK